SGADIIEIVPGEAVRHFKDLGEPDPGEIDTGNPRIVSDFLARALKSYSPQTRKSIGFWGHGTGVVDTPAFAANLVMAPTVGLAASRRIKASLRGGSPFLRMSKFAEVEKDFNTPGPSDDALTNSELNHALKDAFQ